MSVRNIARNFQGLRSALFDEVDALRAGQGDIDRIRVVVALAGGINDTIHAEAKARKMLSTSGVDDAALKGMVA